MNRFTEYELEKKILTPIGGYWACKPVSLEESLECFLTQIDELQRSIEYAKNYCKYPSLHNLTLDESAALMLYTMEAGGASFYRILNRVLRKENRKEVISWFSYLKLLDTALRKLPIYKGIAWRAVSSNVVSGFTIGQTLTWWSISSCSTSAKVVKDFLKPHEDGTLFMIETINGRNITGYTAFPDESEIILGVGTKLRVADIGFEYGNLHVVHLIEITNDGKDKQPCELFGCFLYFYCA